MTSFTLCNFNLSGIVALIKVSNVDKLRSDVFILGKFRMKICSILQCLVHTTFVSIV